MKPSVLVIDDEKTFRLVVEEALEAEGFEVTTAASGQAGLKAFRTDPANFIILDRHLPDGDGVQVLEELQREARDRDIEPMVIMATAYADVQSAVAAVKLGAHDYMTKPLQLPELIVTMRKALEAKRLRTKVTVMQEREREEDEFLAVSGLMLGVLDQCDKVAQSAATTVLIQGETGTGKELIARRIHNNTPERAAEPFIEINCASLPENLLESELFGYERGAFTDARQSKRGLFEAADRGTLFLDEVGELTASTQAKLLKVLEEQNFRRLGGTRDLKVDVRVVAATNKDLQLAVEKGAFRLDLYHRLDVFHLHLPPLRERRDDVLPLARLFLKRFVRRMGRGNADFAPEAERILAGYSYPGNVRELRNLVERALILGSGNPTIGPECIVLSGGSTPSSAAGSFFTVQVDDRGAPPTLADLEKAYITRLLDFAAGNRAQVARLLGVSYPTVAKKISDYGIGQ
jgi:two-component system, NtrC family, response regulator AtoC